MLQLLLMVVNLIKMNNRNKQCVINVDKSVVYLEEQIIKLKRDLEIVKSKLDKECNPLKEFNLLTSITDNENGDDGTYIVSEHVKQISADEQYLKFVDSPESVSNIPGGHTVLTFSDNIKDIFNLNITPLINFKWDSINVRQGVIKRFDNSKKIMGGNNDISVNIQKLIINIPDFNSIKNYNPILLIDRFKPKSYKGNNKYRTSGFKHEKQQDLVSNNRNNEFLLTSNNQIIDINPETYFGVKTKKLFNDNRDVIYIKGDSKTDNVLNHNGLPLVPFTYLRFRLRLSIGSKIVETGSVGTLKVVLSSNNSITFNHA